MDDYKACPARTRLIGFKADGSKEEFKRCTEQSAPMANKNVDPADCDECPVRKLLVNSDQYRPLTPKPSPTSRAKRDGGGGGFVPCDLRQIVNVKTCCGGQAEIRVCDSDEAPYYQGRVTPEICAQCPHRKNGG